MSERADVIVVGGGILGLSTAVHLLSEGAGRVTLVERDRIVQGTTAAGGGFIGPSYAAGYSGLLGAEELAVERYSLEFYRDVAERHEFGFRQDGALFVARDEDAWGQLRGLAEHEAGGHRVAIEPDAVEQLTQGVVRGREITRGLFDPEWAQLSAGDAAKALGREFVARGGRLLERTPVTELLIEGERVTGVKTLHGTVSADHVVLAAGSWTNELLARHGRFLPMVGLIVSRIVTEPQGVPSTIPSLFLAGYAADGNQWIWAREERGGMLWGIRYHSGSRLMLVDDPPPERYDQLRLDGVNEQREAGARAAGAVPQLMHPAYTVGHGAPCHTVDGRAILGPLEGLEGLHVCGGCNEAGVIHAPGWGKVVAERIVHGASRLTDIDVWRADRFDPELRTAAQVLAAHEPTRRE